MSASDPSSSDSGLLSRVQQDNQRQILSKLLHDLRNPVHSIRISMELFGRLARRDGNLEKLMERAAAYIGPAEAAMDTLVANTERLGKYLAVAPTATVRPMRLHELLLEVVLLLRASKRRMHVTCSLPESDAAIEVDADRVRLSHVLLHCCFGNKSASVSVSARIGQGEATYVELHFQADAAGEGRAVQPLLAQELQKLVEDAGGTLVSATDEEVALRFRRSSAGG